jgi:hypothetical protein
MFSTQTLVLAQAAPQPGGVEAPVAVPPTSPGDGYSTAI